MKCDVCGFIPSPHRPKKSLATHKWRKHKTFTEMNVIPIDWRIFLAVAAIIYSHNLGGKIKELHRLEALGKLAKELNKKNVK